MAVTYPTVEAWEYFVEHLDDIREVVADFAPRPWFPTIDGVLHDKSETHSIDEFDSAVVRRDAEKLFVIMNSAWLSAPEDREVYRIPGFSEMCNLLDFTVEGFVDEDRPYEEEDD